MSRAAPPRAPTDRRVLPLVVFSTALGLAIAAVHAAPEVLPPGLRACQQEKDDAVRLACYDRELARYTVPPEQTFGLSPEGVRRTQHLQSGAAEPLSLSAKVTQITQRPRGELVFTLDNGQVWVQQEAGESRIRVGDLVSVKHGSFSSYFLYSPSKQATRVKRER